MEEWRDWDIGHIIEEYSATIYKIAFTRLKNRQDADDVFQDVFLKYALANKNFNDSEHLKAWLIRVTINCCNKKFHTKNYLPLDYCNEPFYEKFDTEKKTIFDGIMSLSIKQRTALFLFYYEDHSIKQISQAMNVSQNNAKIILLRARNKLKEVLKKDLFLENDENE
ncbi:MAG TPA: sigma-70 family RNA polymerase sigma factor [Clostridia bacterium]|nr:sigma-70 family RNA polymerase sigma factor [Clostridia bacterium]